MIRRAATLLEAQHDLNRAGTFGVVATSIPRRRRERGAWIDTIEAIEQVPIVAGITETATLRERELPHGEGAPAQFSIRMRQPPIGMTTDEPERPGCCRYRDFSRGSVEVGWAGPDGPDDSAFALIKSDDEEYFLAPSIASQHRQQYSRKIDYGFACQLAGEAKRVFVVYAGAEDV